MHAYLPTPYSTAGHRVKRLFLASQDAQEDEDEDEDEGVNSMMMMMVIL